ncbi:hypothetical protein GIB67_003106 [Kingdonia uniflora]|uniref:DUF4218 domain-containing protein n=1 Tax=Kingdonia uniflora TaxID=39325 RepID=A0A7J7N6A5_9MAGN|nr:hypothetical protein GIB67_003106 [Kingdonia uniflora]
MRRNLCEVEKSILKLFKLLFLYINKNCAIIFYIFKRRMKTFKDDVMNKARPEDCIAHAYLLQETLIYCTKYKVLGNLSILTKLEKSLDGSLSVPPDLLNVIDYNENDDEGGPVGSSKEFIIDGIEYEQAHMWVLKSQPYYDT